jgi:hypothetical protein
MAAATSDDDDYRGCHMYYEDDPDDIIRPATDVFEIQDFTAATGSVPDPLPIVFFASRIRILLFYLS